MGRRALRKIDTTVELSQHLVMPEELPDPWNTAALFGHEAPVQIEIGSGKGLFLETVATALPEELFLGIEIAEKYAEYCAVQLAKLGISNVKMVHGDAQPLFQKLLLSNSIAAVHIYFPDPWWKRRHRKRRVMNEPLLLDVARVLVPGGKLHFWTDVQEYFETALKLLRQKIPLEGPFDVPEHTPDHARDYQTHFERRKRKDGKPIYRSEFVKPLTS